jgi:SOS response regulatory protein OraA/RecX
VLSRSFAVITVLTMVFDPRLFGLATRLLIGRLHSCGELRTKLMRVALRANARKSIAAAATTNGHCGGSGSGIATAAAATTNGHRGGSGSGIATGDGDGDLGDIDITDTLSAAAAIDAVIAELKNRGLLNDDEYARWHIDQRTGISPDSDGNALRRPRSRAQLTGELLAKRVSSDIAIKAIGAHSDYDAAIRAAQRKPLLTDSELKKHLRWKAFSWASIQAAISLRNQERAFTAMADITTKKPTNLT